MYLYTTVEPDGPQSCDVPGQRRSPFYDGDYSFNTGHLHHLHALDHVFFSCVLVISILVGMYQAWRYRSSLGLEMYTLAGRSMSSLPVAMSMTAAYISAISIMETPEEVYKYSTMYVWDIASLIIAGVLTTTLFVPTLYQLKLATTFEYLERRFSNRVRVVAASLFILEMIMYLSFVLYAPSLALNSATGMNLVGLVLAIGMCCTFCVTIGGITTIIWTDTFQVNVIVVGLIAVLIEATSKVGSFSNALDSLNRSGRLDFSNFRVDPTSDHTVWNYIFGSTLLWISWYAANQNTNQRLQTCKSLSSAKLASWLVTPFLILLHILCIIMGIFMAAFYEYCDPMRSGLVKHSNKLAITFVMDIHGEAHIIGLFLAAIFAAALSTFSPGLNAIAHVILEDFLKPNSKTVIKDRQARKIMQFFSLLVGSVCLILTYMIAKSKNLLMDLILYIGSVEVPIMVVFSLGLFCPHINSVGALVGLLCSVTTSLALGASLEDVPNYELAQMCISNCNVTAFNNASQHLMKYNPAQTPTNMNAYNAGGMSFWYILPISAAVCVVVAFPVSYYTGFNDPKDLDPRLIVPVLDVLFPFFYLPEGVREIFRFGIVHTKKWERSDKSFLRSEDSETSPTVVEHKPSGVNHYLKDVEKLPSIAGSVATTTKDLTHLGRAPSEAPKKTVPSIS